MKKTVMKTMKNKAAALGDEEADELKTVALPIGMKTMKKTVMKTMKKKAKKTMKKKAKKTMKKKAKNKLLNWRVIPTGGGLRQAFLGQLQQQH